MQTNFTLRHRCVFALSCFVDLAFIIYWLVVFFDVVPEKYMFRDYHTDVMVAWNWSFFPLDILVSITGFIALSLLLRKNSTWPFFMTISLTLMFCAGLQAIVFWWLVKDFDITWWAMNLFLMIVPCVSARLLHHEFKAL